MSLIRIEDVDVVFSKSPKPALDLLDQGLSRDEIFKKTGLIVGVEKANLEVQRGEICVLMGLSGSGKSSLLRCINGLNTVSRGRLLIEHEGAEVDIANCSAATLQGHAHPAHRHGVPEVRADALAHRGRERQPGPGDAGPRAEASARSASTTSSNWWA